MAPTIPPMPLAALPKVSAPRMAGSTPRQPRLANTALDSVSIRFSGLTQAQVNQEVAQAHRLFSDKMMVQLGDRAKKENTIFSPASVWNLLTVLLNGAEGDTRDEILKAMELDSVVKKGATLEQLVEGTKAGTESLKGLPKVTLDSAYGVWSVAGSSFKPGFTQRLSTLGAEVSTFNLGDAKPINQWVDKNTHGKITEILKDSDLSDPNTAAVLGNALYMKADWSN